MPASIAPFRSKVPQGRWPRSSPAGPCPADCTSAYSKRMAEVGPAGVRLTRSQIAFLRDTPFAWVWVPDRYLHGDHAPLGLTLTFPQRVLSPRWKQIVQPAKGRFT